MAQGTVDQILVVIWITVWIQKFCVKDFFVISLVSNVLDLLGLGRGMHSLCVLVVL